MQSKMNVFTDDDLKMMKETCLFFAANEETQNGYIDALLARLEAAENCIPYHECQDDLSTCPHLGAWRKLKGE